MIKPISYKGKTFGYIIKYTRKLGVNFLTPKKSSKLVKLKSNIISSKTSI